MQRNVRERFVEIANLEIGVRASRLSRSMRPMGLWISNNRLKVREEEEEERGGDRPSRKVEERHPRSERARGTNEDRYITLDHLLAKSFENVLIVFALESVTERRTGGWTLPLSAYPWRKSIYPEGSFVVIDTE